MASPTELKKRIGPLFIVGFDGTTVPRDFHAFVQEFHIGGVIYFKRNYESPTQLAELSNELQFSCRPKEDPGLFISIDHEGGKVHRLSAPFTKFPINSLLGEMGSPKLCFEVGATMGKELKAVGININYAPVVDVNSNPSNPVIGDRAFSSDPDVCGRLGSAVCRGLQKAGVLAVAKHFPGHGDTKEDSHFVLARVDKSISDMEALELIPFKRTIKSRVDGIMTAHMMNPQIDPKYPATLSEKTINGLLRKNLRYNKLVFSDDMEMKAISDNFGKEEAAVLSIKAGCDLLIYRADQGLPVYAIEALIRAVESGEISMETLKAANQRIETAKKTYAHASTPVDIKKIPESVGLASHIQLAEAIARKEMPAGLTDDKSED